MPIEIPDIPGAADVVRWFGYWPSFHDAEVLAVALHRSRSSIIEIHAFEMTSEVDARGHYVTTKHAIVTFLLDRFPINPEGNATTRIDYFNQQNVLSGFDIKKLPDGGYKLTLDGCFGVDGSLRCEQLSVKLQPGIPEDSVYTQFTD